MFVNFYKLYGPLGRIARNSFVKFVLFGIFVIHFVILFVISFEKRKDVSLAAACQKMLRDTKRQVAKTLYSVINIIQKNSIPTIEIICKIQEKLADFRSKRTTSNRYIKIFFPFIFLMKKNLYIKAIPLK